MSLHESIAVHRASRLSGLWLPRPTARTVAWDFRLRRSVPFVRHAFRIWRRGGRQGDTPTRCLRRPSRKMEEQRLSLVLAGHTALRLEPNPTTATRGGQAWRRACLRRAINWL